MNLKKAMILVNFQANVVDLHLPEVTHPLATILPLLVYTSPSSTKYTPLNAVFLKNGSLSSIFDSSLELS